EADAGVCAFVEEARSFGAGFAGGPVGWYERMVRVQELAREAGDDRHACMVSVHLTEDDVYFGELERAPERARAALAEATGLGLPNFIRGAHMQLAEILSRLGRHAEAVAEARQMAASVDRMVYPALASGFRIILSRVLAVAGHLEEGERVAREAV